MHLTEITASGGSPKVYVDKVTPDTDSQGKFEKASNEDIAGNGRIMVYIYLFIHIRREVSRTFNDRWFRSNKINKFCKGSVLPDLGKLPHFGQILPMAGDTN